MYEKQLSQQVQSNSRQKSYIKKIPTLGAISVILVTNILTSACSDSNAESVEINSVPIPTVLSKAELKAKLKAKLESQIVVGQKELEARTEEKNQLESLYKEDENDYKHYYDRLNNLMTNYLDSHETLVRECQNPQYIDICNMLRRTAILKNSLTVLQTKIDVLNGKISTLDQNLWEMRRKIKLDGIFSDQEHQEIDKLIDSNTFVIQQKTSPSEAQDIPKLEKDIFDEIIRQRSGGL